jgi:hypothetical protein
VESNRRRAERHPSDLPGRLRLAGQRQVAVRIRNIGLLGALCEIHDLEEPVLEGERALLTHPELIDDQPGPADGARVDTPGAIVRVDLELMPEGIVRHVAIHFDGGKGP